jgi:hypothetical protein
VAAILVLAAFSADVFAAGHRGSLAGYEQCSNGSRHKRDRRPAWQTRPHAQSPGVEPISIDLATSERGRSLRVANHSSLGWAQAETDACADVATLITSGIRAEIGPRGHRRCSRRWPPALQPLNDAQHGKNAASHVSCSMDNGPAQSVVTDPWHIPICLLHFFLAFFPALPARVAVGNATEMSAAPPSTNTDALREKGRAARTGTA